MKGAAHTGIERGIELPVAACRICSWRSHKGRCCAVGRLSIGMPYHHTGGIDGPQADTVVEKDHA